MRLFKRKKKNREKERLEEKRKLSKRGLGQEARNAIIVIMLFALAFLNIVSFFDKAGYVGRYFLQGINYLFGAAKYLTPLIFIVAALSILARL